MGQPLRIVSYNVRYFGHALKGLASSVGPKRRISAALLGLSPLPDIICFQEVETISLRSRMALRSPKDGETQLEAFMGRFTAAFEAQGSPFPYDAFYFGAHSYRVGSRSIYTTGLAILVNRETLRVDRHNVAEPHKITHHHVQRFKARKQSRICAHVCLCDKAGNRFHIFNTHLSLPTPFAKSFWAESNKMGFGVNQLHEAKTVATFAARHSDGEPFILCGDFNSAPGSPVYRYLTEEAGLQGAQESLRLVDCSRPKGFATAGFMRLRMHLDHLFSSGVDWLDMNETCSFGDAKGAFHGLSDHVPLIGRFLLPSKSKG